MTHTAPPRRTGYGFYAAASIVVANMIGTGVFTSLGFLMLWVLGGIAAFCGAITYAELGAAMPRSGGEYTFLGRIYHPGAGFVSGWISATIGFAAPTALAAITFGAYLSAVFPGLPETALAVVLVVALSGIHATTHRNSGALQSSFTSVKVVLILAFCAAALFMTPDPQPVALVPASGDAGLVFGGGFYTPAEVLLRGNVTFPEVPQWTVLDRAQVLAVQVGLGIDLHGPQPAPAAFYLVLSDAIVLPTACFRFYVQQMLHYKFLQ